MGKLDNLFSGGRNKPTFEVVLAKRGKSGRRLKIATHNADGCHNFIERNKPQPESAQPVAG